VTRRGAPPLRRIEEVRAPPPGHWVGDGFPVRTMLSYATDAATASPFLLLDYAAPRAFRPTADRRGVGSHPHRGFETVTLAFQGEVKHRDSAGNRGRIGPGDVQWMTAGAGVLHEEMHGRAFSDRGGTFEMAQVWVNLPRARKRVAPGYQDLRAADIPVVPLEGGAGAARLVAGDLLGARGPARTFTPVEMWDLDLAAGGRADLPVPAGHTTLLLITRGPLVVQGVEVEAEHLVRLDRGEGAVRLEAGTPARALLLAGEPIDEPVVGHGPFVMNTKAEILEAIDDFQRGRFGALE
jgi:redox-sensitive bicupin YhaK (pirin superfamily)